MSRPPPLTYHVNYGDNIGGIDLDDDRLMDGRLAGQYTTQLYHLNHIYRSRLTTTKQSSISTSLEKYKVDWYVTRRNKMG